MKFFNQFGQPSNVNDVAAADALIRLKKKSGSNPWPVIEKCLEIWEKKHPQKYQSYVLYLDTIRETRKDKKFGSTTDAATGGILRYTIDFPVHVMQMIRVMYSPDELPMNKEFFDAFGKRFPKFRIAEKS
jgi:hypothetical protein